MPFALALLLVASPVASPALAQSADEDAIRRVIERFTTAFAAGDADAVAALYTDDAQFLAPGLEPLEGPGAIGAFLRGTMDAGIDRLALETVELEAFGDTAYEVGTYELLAGGEVADRGKYLVIWKRGADGAWRLHRDIINTSIPSEER